MKRFVVLICLLFLFASALSAQKTAFENVKIRRHRSAEKRALVDKYGTLTFDDSARKLTFKSETGERIEIGYDEVQKAISEFTTHMRGGGVSRAVTFVEPPFGWIAGSALASVRVNSYWLFLRYRNGENDTSILLGMPESSSAKIVDKPPRSLAHV
jgi:hypothetical protein